MYKTREEVENWLIKMGIANYVINEDLKVDVDGTVDISYNNLKEIPIRFGQVNDDFYCDNNELTNLEGFPKVVNGSFYCYDNKLTSLKNCPKIVNGNFHCYNNELTSLKDCPKVVNGNFHCYNNKLTSLKDCPIEVNGNFYCQNNELTSLEHFPLKINGKCIHIEENKIKEELCNFNCYMKNISEIYSDFNEDGKIEEFLEKVNYYTIKKENELLIKISKNSNNIKLNKKL